MGVITRCCTRESIISNSQISLYSNSDSENIINKINELPSNSDKYSVFQFITSNKFYKLLTQKVSKNSIISQIAKGMNTNEIILLMNELLKWINSFEAKNSDKDKIDIIKINAKCSFEFLLKEMQKNNYEEKNNYFMIKALSYLSLIVQSLLFLNNHEKDKDDIYKINIWKNKDIIKETKKYGFQGEFFILLYKNKNININGGDKSKIKEEVLQELNQYYKVSVNFCNDLVFD